MASINFPESLNMAAKAPAAPADPLITRFRSDNPSYQSGDIIRIELSTGGRGQYLLPVDSYLSFDFTADASNVRLDGCAMSIFRRARVIHGSTTLVDTQHCGRLWNALRDIMVNSSARAVDEVRLATEGFSTQNQTTGGFTGIPLTSGATYDAAFALPLPLVGTLSKSALPIGLMGASSLYIELEIAPMSEILTSRAFSDPDGAVPTGTTTLSRFTVSNIYYNAKITTLEPAYDAALMSVYAGRPLMLPATDYIGESKVIPSGAAVINEKFAFSRSSVNGILWWLSNSTVANGASYDTSANRLDGTTHRQAGDLAEYYVAVSGKNLQSIYAGRSGIANSFKGANAVQQIGRIYNTMSSVDGMGILNQTNYCNIVDHKASAAAITKRFVGAYSLERYDSDAKYASGSNLVGQDVRLVVQFTTALADQQNLYGFAMCDCGYELIDGQLNLRS